MGMNSLILKKINKTQVKNNINKLLSSAFYDIWVSTLQGKKNSLVFKIWEDTLV